MSAARASRWSFTVNAAVASALLIVLAAIALVVQPPAPPGIAEFAPTAVKPVTKAPPGQSATNGEGAGACVEGLVCAQASATPGALGARPAPVPSREAGVPSALQCYTWPDGSVTQTFDPQSPPCIASWPDQAKGNGGATSPGVSATEIRVALPRTTSNPTGTSPALLEPIVRFVNSHYQLWGRRIRLVPFESKQSQAACTTSDWANPSAQRADAAQVSTLKVFAAVDFQDCAGNILALPEYFATLARRKVVTVIGGANTPFSTTADITSKDPYVWSYLQPYTELMAATGSLVCRQMAGKNAIHAPEYSLSKRKFAIVIPDQGWTGVSLAPGLNALRSKLAACGIDNPPVVYDTRENRGSNLSTSFVGLKANGVTTLLWMTWLYDGTGNDPLHVADHIGYNPEWVSMAWQAYYQSAYGFVSTLQSGRLMGVGNFNKLHANDLTPWYQAYAAAGGAPAGKYLQEVGPFYEELQLLAAGAQLAGPKLTPETFGDAMHSTRFPNPGAGRSPAYQGRVSFADQSAAMVDDYVAFWMDPTAGQAQFAEGAPTKNPWRFFCYQDLGVRHLPGSWPTQDRFYQPRCR